MITPATSSITTTGTTSPRLDANAASVAAIAAAVMIARNGPGLRTITASAPTTSRSIHVAGDWLQGWGLCLEGWKRVALCIAGPGWGCRLSRRRTGGQSAR